MMPMIYLLIFIAGIVFDRFGIVFLDVLTTLLTNRMQLSTAKTQTKIDKGLPPEKEEIPTQTRAIGFHMDIEDEYLDDEED